MSHQDDDRKKKKEGRITDIMNQLNGYVPEESEKQAKITPRSDGDEFEGQEDGPNVQITIGLKKSAQQSAGIKPEEEEEEMVDTYLNKRKKRGHLFSR